MSVFNNSFDRDQQPSTENSGGNREKRGRVENLRPFKAGQSGNPGGRPKRTLVDEALIGLLEAKDSAEALEIAKAILARAKKGDIRAIQLICERTQGKPRQKLELRGGHEGETPARFTIRFVDSKGGEPGDRIVEE